MDIVVGNWTRENDGDCLQGNLLSLCYASIEWLFSWLDFIFMLWMAKK